LLKGLKAGRTIAIALFKHDSLKFNTLRLNVIAPQPIDNWVALDSVMLFTDGELTNIKAKVYPANYSQNVLWFSLCRFY
jgi:hypothetical protein